MIVLSFYFAIIQDLRISGTPFNALTAQEQEIFKARCRLLCMMGDLMRQAARHRELENLAEKERRMSRIVIFCLAFSDVVLTEWLVTGRTGTEDHTSPQQQQTQSSRFGKYVSNCSVHFVNVACYKHLEKMPPILWQETSSQVLLLLWPVRVGEADALLPLLQGVLLLQALQAESLG